MSTANGQRVPPTPTSAGVSTRRLLTGLRPTGRLHLGNYIGTLENDVHLQALPEYQCFFFVADYHALTTRAERANEIGANVRETLLDMLSAGIDPEKSTLFVQSMVPEVTELFLLFTMLISVSRAQRIPTLKEQIRDLKLDSASLGLLNYPVLQAADILMVRGEVVPVGKDQASHIELAREVARRFNQIYAPVFPEPEALIGRVPTLPGTDGKAKMSKSIGNVILLSDNARTVERAVSRMFTDPTRVHATDPGHVRGNPVFVYHDAFNRDAAEIADLKRRYRAGKVGDVEVKRRLSAALNSFLDPIRERRAYFEGRPQEVDEIVIEGSRAAQREARETLRLAREAMGLTHYLAQRLARGGE